MSEITFDEPPNDRWFITRSDNVIPKSDTFTPALIDSILRRVGTGMTTIEDERILREHFASLQRNADRWQQAALDDEEKDE